MKISKIASYLLSIMLVILLGIGVSGCMSEQEEILNYLEDKYGEKFEVVRYWSEYVGTRERAHHLIAYPKGKPELIFQAEKFWDPLEEKIAFWDGYVQSKWSNNYTEKYKEEMTSLDNREMDVRFKLGVPGYLGSKHLSMTLEEYLKENKEKATKISARVTVAIKSETRPNTRDEVILIQSIYKKLQEAGFDGFYLSLIYVKPGSFAEAKKLTKLKQADAMISLETIGRGNFYYVVYLDERSIIKNPEDIVDKFQTGR